LPRVSTLVCGAGFRACEQIDSVASAFRRKTNGPR
jgi:hypothetical protein